MKIKEIIGALERFAPLPLQDGFDNAGLQIGLTEAEATGALLCLDVTEAVVDEAVTLGYNLIISHHPLIFKGYKSITGRDYIERCILKAIRNDIAIYSAHTNLDNAEGGVNFKIAEKIGLKNVQVLEPKQDAGEDVVAGAGVVGELEEPDDDGGILNEDGSISYPDGSIEFPDGTIYNPDGTITHPDGTTTDANGGPIQDDPDEIIVS